jgi:hypothetical protein
VSLGAAQIRWPKERPRTVTQVLMVCVQVVLKESEVERPTPAPNGGKK